MAVAVTSSTITSVAYDHSVASGVDIAHWTRSAVSSSGRSLRPNQSVAYREPLTTTTGPPSPTGATAQALGWGVLLPTPPPAPPPVPTPPPPPIDATSTATADWRCIRVHESGDEYNDPSRPSGAYGIIQVTWRSNGFSGWPYEAAAAFQDALALKLYNEYGWHPWSSRFACGL
jgi:hypothetical protein